MLSLHNLALYGVLFVLACLVIGFLLAVFIDQNVRGEGVLRTVFLYPYAMSFVATGLVWQWLLTPGDGIDGAIRALGLARLPPRLDRRPGHGHLHRRHRHRLAGLGPGDGADAGRPARHRRRNLEGGAPGRHPGLARLPAQIVLPMLWPTIATVLLLLATAVVKLYDAVVAMTQGGPGIASEVPAKFIMDHLFLRSNVGLASAGAVVLLVPVLALLAPYAYARSRKEAA
jgi:glucose/mannose transport system permease protein